MKTDNGQSTSIWMASANVPGYPLLTKNLRVSHCVVGAGIAGLTTAYRLLQEGFQVAVVDDGLVGGGETSRTTAQLTCMLDLGYAETEKLRGTDGARLAAASHSAAISEIEQIILRENIDCEFARMDGFLFLGPDDTTDTLTEEYEAAQRAGLTGVALVDQLMAGGKSLGPALRFPHQGHFHILKYLSGLCQAIERMGGAIYSGTHVTKLQSGPPITLETEAGFQIVADTVVLATNVPIIDVLGYSAKLSPHRTYVIGLRVPKGSVTQAIYFDTEDPYHYLRIQPEGDHDVLMVGGEDHKTGQADDMDERYIELESWARDHFPTAEQVLYKWSGQVINSLDGLALIGPDLVEKNVYIITGDTGMGMTHGTIGGLLVTDMIAGRPNPWAKLYDPARIPARALGTLLQEGINVVAQYTELLTGGEVTSETDIPLGSGAIMGWGPNKVAVYRNAQGTTYTRSAVCPHLGCIVAWNDGEKSWDCPCHGSRFDPYGHVVNGPAASDLGPASSE